MSLAHKVQIGSWLDPKNLDLHYELPDAAVRAELEPGLDAALVALGVAIDEAAARDPRRPPKKLLVDPARTAFQSIFAQLGGQRLINLLLWLTEPAKPHREALLAALFTPSAGGASEAVHKAARAAARAALIARMRANVRMSSLLLCVIEHQRDRDLFKDPRP